MNILQFGLDIPKFKSNIIKVVYHAFYASSLKWLKIYPNFRPDLWLLIYYGISLSESLKLDKLYCVPFIFPLTINSVHLNNLTKIKHIRHWETNENTNGCNYKRRLRDSNRQSLIFYLLLVTKAAIPNFSNFELNCLKMRQFKISKVDQFIKI